MRFPLGWYRWAVGGSPRRRLWSRWHLGVREIGAWGGRDILMRCGVRARVRNGPALTGVATDFTVRHESPPADECCRRCLADADKPVSAIATARHRG